MELDFGNKIKRYRNKNNMTIQEFANKTGLSTALLSQIERNIANPTINVLKTVSDAIGISISELLAPEIKNIDLVLRASERKIVFDSNHKHIMYSILANAPTNNSFDVLMIHLDPFSESDYRLSSHPQEEALIILEGEVEMIFEDEIITLYVGDTIRILPNRLHRLKNTTGNSMVGITFKSQTHF
ncbi:MAG: DNA-binding protein [Anaerocolumna sp.]|jgi:transcriptional regulator with XRE-family HTH domain|nr:DNA-binding protein [Anaerocolumna sp.]